MKAAILIATATAAMGSYANVRTVPRPIERSYIAKVSGATCTEVGAKIDSLKWSVEGYAAVGREGQPLVANIATSCFVEFKAGPAVASVVSTWDDVEYVEEDGIFEFDPELLQQITDANNAQSSIQAVSSWGLDRLDQGSSSTKLDNSYTPVYDGEGYTVFVIDTGINVAHTDFGGRAELGNEFVTDNGGRDDQNGHGTHCAGTVGGTSYGVAPKANLVAVKVLSGSGSGSNAGVLNGVKWASDEASKLGKPGVLSMSLGGGVSQALNDAVKAASDAGHIVVVASGNDNKNACNYSPASAGGSGDQGGVITVNSMTRTDGRSSFSNFGTCSDIFAPGSEITSAWIGSSSATRTISGTSMACPHVAGVAAVLLQASGGNKAEAISTMFELAKVNQISNAGQGSPNLLVQVPVESISPTPPTTPPPVTSPTPPPVGSPTTNAPVTAPTQPPSGDWTCPQEWFGASDGCDCECGGGDPDCAANFDKLYCNGRNAQWYEVCNFETDTCESIFGMTRADVAATGRNTGSFESKVRSDAGGSVLLPAAIGGAGALVALSILAVGLQRRRNSAAGDVTVEGNVVRNPKFDPEDI